MRKSSSRHNLELLAHVANRLEELCDEVVFVGGTVTGFLVTDKAAPDVRFTVDVDCIINVVTRSDYYTFAEKLRRKGFKEMSMGDHPICRWNCDGALLDVVPTNENILGFSNRWYKDAISNAITRKINQALSIKIISSPYFLATKLDAFRDRGKNDFLLSHDIEDIVSLIDGRPEIISDISNSNTILKRHLSSEFTSFINNNLFTQALPGHLNYTHESEGRKKIVLERIQEIIAIK